MPRASLTLAWTRATVENDDGVIVAVVERSAVNAEHWHLTWMITPPTIDGRRRAMGDTETMTWAEVRHALSRGEPGHYVVAAAGATASHDYLRREAAPAGVVR